ncbi:hypothetical protein ACFYPN_30625 [Streptomyces sp. NPDC005576]
MSGTPDRLTGSGTAGGRLPRRAGTATDPRCGAHGSGGTECPTARGVTP